MEYDIIKVIPIKNQGDWSTFSAQELVQSFFNASFETFVISN